MLARMKDYGSTFLKVWFVADRVHLGLIAAGVAFFAMFALFPALAAVIAIFGLVADPIVIQTQLELVRELIPPDAYDALFSQLENLLSARPETLTFATVLSLSVALFSARAGVAALMLGLNSVYDRPVRGGLRHILAAITMTFSLIGVALTALLMVVVAPVVIAHVPLPWRAAAVLELLRWLIAFMVLLAGLGILYRFGPNRREARPSWVTPGALVVIVLWLAASTGFSLYLSNFGRYNEVYGSIGAAAAMLMWLYISAYLILFGAALNVAIEKRGLAREGPRPTELEHPEPGSQESPLGS
ncbi:YihY/virulence factor BrkB family protein [Wenxinia marina]|uniref:Putative membrane protein n=1 Tax=Wenxinia marina DSM 24838 TaxID=1123501 RepID=A0A0D0NKI7_9RHOB|nr:YihY/virulence factor BrkB family protein [Wenxinia marina]KIQ68835.1 putative membrane protein [Wenxinia marina DSM 24838]GGL64851.1 hypothetical protein GCM10011392_19370 [Wenxinia marina]